MARPSLSEKPSFASSKSLSKIGSFIKNDHTFVLSTLYIPTTCSCCNTLIWSVSQQVLKCEHCAYICHTDCLNNVRAPCLKVEKIEMSPMSPELIYFNRFKKEYFRELEAQININNTIKNTINPEANFITVMPKNFTGFIEKTHPLVVFQSAFESILFWYNTNKSLLALFIWTLICIRPQLVLIAPPIALVAYCLYNLIDISSIPNHSTPSLNTSKNDSNNDTNSNYNDLLNLMGSSENDSSFKPGFLWGIQNYMIKNLTFKNSNSPNLTENLRFNQNITGHYLSAYSAVETYSKYLMWDQDPHTTALILGALCCIILFEMIVLYYIPLSFLIWAIGSIAFLAFNPHIRTFFIVVVVSDFLSVREKVIRYFFHSKPEFIDNLLLSEQTSISSDNLNEYDLFNQDLHNLTPDIHKNPISGSLLKNDPDEPLSEISAIQNLRELKYTISHSSLDKKKKITLASDNDLDSINLLCGFPETLIEHQRYWIGVGWAQKLYPSDPNVWTDDTEVINYSEKIDKAKLDCATIIKDNFSIDKSFNDSAVDSSGWSYTNNFWKDPKQNQNIFTYTRKRKWYKNFKKISKMSQSDIFPVKALQHSNTMP
ncbi:hypothetical protein BB561_005266 [Smittium simulii]|uniref:Phorbol-ester/DAG-type domain-containing protein n=1 Tax=Smittium simulii TaxID=133385 RepID=A0A2T9YB87_9FUNG|nr:hypothetical protein BB561_005266 [Smittium simulii]